MDEKKPSTKACIDGQKKEEDDANKVRDTSWRAHFTIQFVSDNPTQHLATSPLFLDVASSGRDSGVTNHPCVQRRFRSP